MECIVSNPVEQCEESLALDDHSPRITSLDLNRKKLLLSLNIWLKAVISNDMLQVEFPHMR